LGSAGRFIPACAGNASRRNFRGIVRLVHPRVCGERARIAADRSASRGSSPRVRGTPQRQDLVLLVDRFIPACAGNAIVTVPSRRYRWVHPRVCGERWWTASVSAPLLGSSPRVRGTQAPAATT